MEFWKYERRNELDFTSCSISSAETGENVAKAYQVDDGLKYLRNHSGVTQNERPRLIPGMPDLATSGDPLIRDSWNLSYQEMDSRVLVGNEKTGGSLTATMENQAAKLPSAKYLGLAFASRGASAILKAMGRDSRALFAGQWAAPLLISGTYNKLEKQHGSHRRDQFERAA